MTCPHCGKTLLDEAVLCDACGCSTLSEEGPESILPTSPPPRPRRKWPWILAVLLLLAAMASAVAGGLWYYHRQQGGSSTAPDSSEPEISSGEPVSRTVRVTIPEGYTADRIAEQLEEAGVCTAVAFYEAVQTADFSDYPFVAAIPADSGRACRLEGYLFPDTYEFYRGSTGEAAVRRFLDNFQNRFGPYEEQLAADGRTLEEVVILASLIQWEAGYAEDMSRVSRVLCNRLDNPAEYPRLQCDSTYRYISEWNAARSGVELEEAAYDTYVRRGLPAGAISNPGLAALRAALSPSDEEIVRDCYFFATDYTTGITYYSRTYAEHVAVCREHGIGIHARD